MADIRRGLLRVLSCFRSGRAEAELAREIRSHLQLLEDRFIAQGMSAEEARFAARRAFGGVEQAKEHQRDARSFRWLAGWPMDLKLGVRMLVKSPGLTAVAVIALSIAIAGGVLYLEVINQLFRPTLPGRDGDRIVGIVNRDVAKDRTEHRALHDFARWRETVTTIDDLGAHQSIERNLISEDGRSEPVRGVEISASAFRLMPTPALLGRPLVPDDERPMAPPVMVIGHQLWQTRFAGDPAIVGRTVRLGSSAYTVVGVMPAAFGFPVNHSLWVPLRVTAAGIRRGEGPAIRVFGRLAPGVELEAAQAELTAIGLRAAAEAPDSNQQLRPQVRPYLDSLLAGDGEERLERTILYSVNLFFVGLLAICGANVATLVFARTATREGEITVRTALGASRGRIIGQLFAEALVLVAIATAVGLVAASVGLREITNWIVAKGMQVPFWWDEALAPTTLLYAGGLALFAAAIIGTVPGLKATGPDMQARLKHAAGGYSRMQFGRLWTGVIVAQVGLSVFFLLTVVSLAWNVHTGRNPGTTFHFEPADYLAARIEMDTDAQTDARTRFLAAYHEIERRLEEQPGVAAVTYATRLPGMGQSEFWVELDGIEPASRPADGPLWVRSASVAPDFFDAFNAPLVRGRAFVPSEARSERPVAIVDETFVRLILGGRDPIGVRVRHQPDSATAEPGPWLEIVGVVKDLGAAKGKISEDAMLYRPGAPGGESPTQMIVRARGHAKPLAHAVGAAAGAVDPALRLYDVKPLDEIHLGGMRVHRLMAQALGVVTAVALLLAAAGVHALMSFTLARRTREIGIRAALGAAPHRIVSSIFSRAFGQIGLGVAVGSVPGGALVAFGGVFEAAAGGGAAVALFAVAAVAALIIVIALGACAVPARRALRIHPTEALRADG